MFEPIFRNFYKYLCKLKIFSYDIRILNECYDEGGETKFGKKYKFPVDNN